MNKDYSIIIPVKNEADNIRFLIDEISPIMKSISKTWEMIVIDDGSDDGTLAILKELKLQLPELRILVFSENFGQSSAFEAGFKAAEGKYIITLDGDGQNDPSDIPQLIEAALQGYDLVVGKRSNRKDSFFRRRVSKISNFIRSRICRDGVSDTGCSLKVYKKSSLDRIKLYDGMHRFIPALFILEGYTIKEISVNHRERTKGKSKYNLFNRSIKPIVDMFVVLWMRKRRLTYKIKTEL